MNHEPICISDKLDTQSIIQEVKRQASANKKLNSNFVKHVLVLDNEKRVSSILDFSLLISSANDKYNIAIFGMGFVGITLAASFSNNGYQVTGIDINEKILSNLKQGIPHIHEPGLQEILKNSLKRKTISFSSQLNNSEHNIYIISVGTPIGKDLKPDLSSLRVVVEDLANFLKFGDHVMLRSTVPLGTTRNFVIPTLENISGLRAGKDFKISFAPERTVEGNALVELQNLPQIIGGYSSECLKHSVDFWVNLTQSVVKVESIESAELVKLANNTFRDLSFAFSNELAMLGAEFNINSFELINAANEGYPRNKIPLPSPGVGGYCLTKDPLLFSTNFNGGKNSTSLGIKSREVNKKAANYPLMIIRKFSQRFNMELSNLNVLILGVAFKGQPETNDYRQSISIDIFNEIKNLVNRVEAIDQVINEKELLNLGFYKSKSKVNAHKDADVILILNNHPGNISSHIYSSSVRPKLIFDGWGMLNKSTVENSQNLIYATMGYITP